ncbi:MAG TPA: hypothetical protein VGN54_06770 [Mycobacteriales bacterium]|nr:hypothetical protein [Mycobacteriales bacterium]
MAEVPAGLAVREMHLAEVDLRIDYFHDSSDEYLQRLGVDRALLPARAAWREFYETDYARPISQRLNYSLIWELEHEPVGFSSTDQITFGVQAFMHLHILQPELRKSGLGEASVSRRRTTSTCWSCNGCSASRTRSMSPRTGPCSVPGSATSSPTTPGRVRSTSRSPVTRWVLPRPE